MNFTSFDLSFVTPESRIMSVITSESRRQTQQMQLYHCSTNSHSFSFRPDKGKICSQFSQSTVHCWVGGGGAYHFSICCEKLTLIHLFRLSPACQQLQLTTLTMTYTIATRRLCKVTHSDLVSTRQIISWFVQCPLKKDVNKNMSLRSANSTWPVISGDSLGNSRCWTTQVRHL